MEADIEENDAFDAMISAAIEIGSRPHVRVLLCLVFVMNNKGEAAQRAALRHRHDSETAHQ